MFEVLVFGWAGKALVTTLLVAVLMRLMQRCGQRACGLITGLPTVTGPALLWLAASEGNNFAALAGAGSVAAGALCALFGWGYARASRHSGPAAALAVATVLAVLPAVLLVISPLALGVLLAASIAVSLACIAGLRTGAPRQMARQPTCAPSNVAVTAIVAGVVSGSVSLLAGDLGAFWSGVIAGAPLIAAIVGVRVHLDCGRPAVQAFMGAYCVGLLWRTALAAVFCWLVPSTGAGWAMLLACGAVLAAWAMLSAWRSWWAAMRLADHQLIPSS